MKNLGYVLPFVALTFFSWGVYGPVIHTGQESFGDFENTGQLSTLRPFICVGIAYFIIAVVFPVVVLRSKGEKGHWTMGGFIWSFAAGAVGAIGALGIILAFKFRGSPVYVMPLVFGCAPVVNTFVTMFMAKSFKQASPIFIFGVVVVAVGAAGVMVFKPKHELVDSKEISAAYSDITVEENDEGRYIIEATDSEGTKRSWDFQDRDSLKKSEEAYSLYLVDRQRKRQPTFAHVLLIIFSVALTALCWGSYGPVLHKGQMKMAGSRLRPFMCVGLAYFAIAVVFPFILMPAFPAEPGSWGSFSGFFWSLLGGTAGALGALGIIYSFNFGGKPIFVMPLVFGCAPVVNTFTTMLSEGTLSDISIAFMLSLVLVICGAVTVLVFAPKAGAPAPKKPNEKSDEKVGPGDSPVSKESSSSDSDSEKAEIDGATDAEDNELSPTGENQEN